MSRICRCLAHINPVFRFAYCSFTTSQKNILLLRIVQHWNSTKMNLLTNLIMFNESQNAKLEQ